MHFLVLVMATFFMQVQVVLLQGTHLFKLVLECNICLVRLFFLVAFLLATTLSILGLFLGCGFGLLLLGLSFISSTLLLFFGFRFSCLFLLGFDLFLLLRGWLLIDLIGKLLNLLAGIHEALISSWLLVQELGVSGLVDDGIHA